MIIYLAVNRVNQKAYVGKSVRSFEARIREHAYDVRRTKTRQLFHHEAKRIGIDCFDFAVLELCPPERLKEREQYWIERLGSLEPNGYNVSRGPGLLGVKHKQSVKDKIRDRFLGQPKSEEHRAKLHGPKSPEHIANSRKARATLEYKQKISASLKRAYQTVRSADAQRQRALEQWAKRKASQ